MSMLLTGTMEFQISDSTYDSETTDAVSPGSSSGTCVYDPDLACQL